jgi:hypothetical protein
MTQVYCRNSKLEEAPLGGDLMLFDPDRSKFFVLNSTMAYLWRSCDGAKSFEGIVESVPDQFAETEAHPVATEMKAALDELIQLGMVQPT